MIRLAGILLTLLCWLATANAQTFPGGVPNAFILTNPQGFPLPYTAGDLTATGNCNAATDYLVKFDAGTGTLQKVSCGQIAASTSSGVVGQNPSVIGQIGVWGNTVGTLLLSTDLGAIPYLITGGTTARKDQDRFNDDSTPAVDIGVDCTNVSDSTTAIQTWVNAHLNGGHLRFPNGCQFFTTSTITVTSAQNVVIDSPTPAAQDNGSGGAATWYWKGTNGGATCTTTFSACQYVLDFESVDHPLVQNLVFNSPGGSNCPDGFIKFDGSPVGHTPTAGRVLNSSLGNGACSNPNFVAINISPTAGSNHENYILYNNITFCSSSVHQNIASDGVTNGTTTVTSASNPFLVGMVGERIRLSWDNDSNPNNVPGESPPASRGYFDTTIAGFTNSGSVTLAAAVPFTASPVLIVVGQGYGTAYRNGASQNALQQTFYNLQYFGCAFGVYVAGGGVQISQLTSGFSDVGVYFDGFIAQNSTVDYYASEGDYIAFIQEPGATPPAEFSNGRLSNGTSAANGFLQLGGRVTLRNNLVAFGMQNTNSVLIAPFQTIGINTLGAITPGSGYVSGTYTNVPLATGPFSGPGSVSATVVVSGGAVTTVTITNQGVGFPRPGDILTTANTNLGGSGSGFSVPIVATFSPTTLPSANGAEFFGQVTDIANNWVEGCCGTQITWPRLGIDQFLIPPVVTINDRFNDTVTNVPGLHNLPCASGGTSCVLVNSLLGQAQPLGIGVQANMSSAIVSSGNQVGFRATADGIKGGGGSSFTGFQSFAPVGFAGPATLTGFEAAWNGETTFALGSQTAAYGFRVRTPTTVTFGTLPNSYGFGCDKQKVSNVTNGWCFYNVDAADQNFFAGPTLLGDNTLTVTAGGLGLAKIAASGSAPGAAGGKIELVCGTNSGTAKLIAYAGTSSTPVTIFDNIGSGVTGC